MIHAKSGLDPLLSHERAASALSFRTCYTRFLVAQAILSRISPKQVGKLPMLWPDGEPVDTTKLPHKTRRNATSVMGAEWGI